MIASHRDAIVAEDLARDFEGGRVHAVQGIQLRIPRGEIFGFLGPNGSGKTTTVRMLTTMLRPTGGRAVVGGHDVAADPARVRSCIGVALQDVALDPLLTAWDHMKLQCALHGVPSRDRKARSRTLIQRMGLIDAAGRKVGAYSGGMKRRLDLALALVHAPTILFLDEPTVGLDPQSRAAVWDEVRRLAEDESVTVFLTTQYLEEADLLADRVAILNKGRIVAAGTPRDLKQSVGGRTVVVSPANGHLHEVVRLLSRFGDAQTEKNARVRCQIAQTTDIAEIVRSLDAGGIEFEGVEIHTATLEDVFLQKTGYLLEGAGEDDDCPIGRQP